MIAVKLEGRLGNQLFQYAFIYAAAKKLDTAFYLDKSIADFTPSKYFNLKNDFLTPLDKSLFSIKGYRNIFSVHLRRAVYGWLQKKLLANGSSSIDNNQSASQAFSGLKNNCMYYGYFQSALYFSSCESDIRKNFSLKSRFVDEFNSKYASLYNNNQIVTVHVRRTDYLQLECLNLGGNDLSLPLDYYKKALQQFSGKNVTFVFVTDDVPFAEKNFGYLKNKVISTDTEIMDFQHLLNADACIISNSTFSWWGAWLNSKPNKIIYAPKHFMGWRLKQDHPRDVYPANWNIIDF